MEVINPALGHFLPKFGKAPKSSQKVPKNSQTVPKMIPLSSYFWEYPGNIRKKTLKTRQKLGTFRNI